jgi:hypothetical protein
MPVSIPNRLRACVALAASFAASFALSGCAGMSDTISPAFADPGKYELYDCKQLETERIALAKRATELQKLMDKAETGAGGAVVSELAYRNDYIAARGQAHFAEEAWRRNKCRETAPEATPPASTPQRPIIQPAPKSSAVR